MCRNTFIEFKSLDILKTILKCTLNTVYKYSIVHRLTFNKYAGFLMMNDDSWCMVYNRQSLDHRCWMHDWHSFEDGRCMYHWNSLDNMHWMNHRGVVYHWDGLDHWSMMVDHGAAMGHCYRMVCHQWCHISWRWCAHGAGEESQENRL